MEERIDKLDFIKIKKCSMKEKVKRMRRQATDWEKIFAKKTHLIKDCYPTYTENS